MKIIFLIILGYIIGSISFAYLFTYFLTGLDIRNIGTKNPGAANVARQVGKKWGIIVWIGDTLKGAGSMAIAESIGITNEILLTIIGTFAILGHCYPVFLKFKGGKGISTMGGVMFYLAPAVFPFILGFWFIAQLINPRSPGIILSEVALFFFILNQIYPDSFVKLSVSTLLLILVSIFINRKAIKEMRGAH
ncbi:MAG: Glycerol-3-phosphate acyltransferase [candidate division TA06 bacterium ADurb.Bin131]|uniref:Glycerol-3-phosphate acyltransferase n=1 Tax=candidate division TA06 bacterium ADurb.Bin131 TaxID=1852827 RepID=A0A1V6C5S4_UNCT6|nr:MAG: Glycerol-3-phosphate acyltransferase [candidate division TA06 bacterium ADurb.Bin131]HOC02632.1 glycerol-3-phosphate acyltransferase [bacterium]